MLLAHESATSSSPVQIQNSLPFFVLGLPSFSSPVIIAAGFQAVQSFHSLQPQQRNCRSFFPARH